MSVYAVKRVTKKGPRWYVRVELPAEINYSVFDSATGKYLRTVRPMIHLGTFETEKAAKRRIEAAKKDIDAGRIPRRFEDSAVVRETTLREVAMKWIATRHDIKDITRIPYERMIRTWPDSLADLDPATITHQDVQEWVEWMAKRPKRRGRRGKPQAGLMRGSIARELGVLKLVLDYAERSVDNPARDRRVTLPRRQRGVYRLPTRAQIAELHEALPSRVPLMNLLEHTGLRIHEAANLRWCDIDHARGRLLVQESKTTAGRRFVEHLPGTPEFPRKPEGEDPNRLVFPQARSFTNVLRETHYRKGTFLMSAHEWRHLHASRLLHDQILSPAQIAARMGHTDPGITLRTYTHIVPPD